MKQITDYSGKVIAMISRDTNIDRIYTPNGRYLGYYDKSLDKTYEAEGKYIGPGDQLMRLIK